MDETTLSYVEANHVLLIGTDRRDVRIDGRAIELRATEFDVLRWLAHAPGQTFSRTDILDGINPGQYAITPRAVDGQIADLRQKLGPVAGLIETVRGAGYRFKAVAGSEASPCKVPDAQEA